MLTKVVGDLPGVLVGLLVISNPSLDHFANVLSYAGIKIVLHLGIRLARKGTRYIRPSISKYSMFLAYN